jgi:hypothetical protein
MIRNLLFGQEEKAYPTMVRMPIWSRPSLTSIALSRIKISEPTVNIISERFILERGLLPCPFKPISRLALDPSEVLEVVKSEAPIDGREIVEWMQISAAENIVMQARIAEYNRLGSELIGRSGDAYIPGVVVEDLYYISQTGSDVGMQGYATVRTPRGSFNVPAPGKIPGIFRDILSWGSIPWLGIEQFIGNLLKWKSLAETPITQTVGFYMDSEGQVAPNFFAQIPPRPSLTVAVRMKFSTNTKQTIKINFRDPSDYTRVVGSKSVEIPSGESEVTYTVTAFPYVPPVVSEIQPRDRTQTKLEEYVVV